MQSLRDVWLVRILLGLATGIVLWLIWHMSMTTQPEVASVEFRVAICRNLFQVSTPALGELHNDMSARAWRVLLITFLASGIAFSALKPLARFVLWVLSGFLYAALVIYCFQFQHLVLPWSGPTTLLSCGYLLGTIIYLETEKIERRRQFAVNLQLQAEEERKRIAKDLHDETLPSISGVIRLVDQLSEQDHGNPLPSEIRGRLESCLTEMRRVINDLHPAALEEFGLSVSAAHIVQDFGRRAEVKAIFTDTTNGAQIPPFHQLCIYRIIQEGLNNVAKHSKATEVHVNLERVDDAIVMSITDNGVGGIERRPGCYGLQSISDRAKLISGSVQWKPSEKFSSGTTLLLNVPLKETVCR